MSENQPPQVRIWDELGYTQLIPADRADEATGISGLGEALTTLHNAPRTRGICPACGLTQAQYDETGFVGCGLCYSVFVENAE